ncbi:hypothetical protein TorRG33x02_163540 [Trema orientale]|uniref:CASP-like protein n=1 Tax=Trema orientale TaxID=63057 RepID=A0A2P5EQL6_TREOI|nr:hypothetical protein TorRG33x02_163540 [Trema orientale]
MKKPGLLAASVAVASATAFSASSSNFVCNSSVQFSRQEDIRKGEREYSNSSSSETTSDKFKPRFDGLRFIETLVTAHR